MPSEGGSQSVVGVGPDAEREAEVRHQNGAELLGGVGGGDPHPVQGVLVVWGAENMINRRDNNIVNIFSYILNVSEAIFHHQLKYS